MKMILVFCTVPDVGVGREIAGVLLEQKLAACVSLLGGCESHYVWEGRRETSQEVLLKIKTAESCWEELKAQILEKHPYDCPEILRVDAVDGLGDYLAWVLASVKKKP